MGRISIIKTFCALETRPKNTEDNLREITVNSFLFIFASCEINSDVSVKFVMNFYGILILTVAPKQPDLRMHPSRPCAVDYLLIVCKKRMSE